MTPSTAMSCLHCYTVLTVLTVLLHLGAVTSVELTFELPDSAKECFHEIIEKDVESTLEFQVSQSLRERTCQHLFFQVVTGGHYDVDVILTDPMRKVLYKQVKKQYDSFTWTAEKTGEYVACFSNEFSTFSHKLVYIDFQVSGQVVGQEDVTCVCQVGDEDPLPGMEAATGPLTQVTRELELCIKSKHKSSSIIMLSCKGRVLSYLIN